MRVCFAADVITDDQHWRYLDEILYGVDDGWHEWEVDDPDALEQSEWLSGTNRSFIRELFEKAAKAGVYPNTLHKRRYFVSMQSGADSMPPQAAARYFRRPLFVCGENQFTDGIFLNALLATLSPPELQSFLAQSQGNPIEADHAGGAGELYKRIEWRISESALIGIPFRAIVFTDSDARFPGHEERKPLQIADLCQQHNIDCLVIGKRSIENYIPDEVLRGWANEPGNRAWRELVEIVCRLTAEQRDHLPMKKRLPLQFDTPQETALYASVPTQDLDLLKNRHFDNKIITILETHRQYLTADGLRARDGKGELDSLITMIIEAL